MSVHHFNAWYPQKPEEFWASMWVLGMNPSSGRAASVLNWAISPAFGTVFLRCKCKANHSNLSVIQNSSTRWEGETGKTPKACGQDSLVYSQRKNLAQHGGGRRQNQRLSLTSIHAPSQACAHTLYTHFMHTHAKIKKKKGIHVLAFRGEFLMGPFAAWPWPCRYWPIILCLPWWWPWFYFALACKTF